VRWENYNVWSIWIVGAKYITILSHTKMFTDVMEAVREQVDEEKRAQFPLVMISFHYISTDEFDRMTTYPEGEITLVME
jgi:hypothetical protein